MKKSAIVEFLKEFENSCLVREVPPDMHTHERWVNDPVEYARSGFSFRPWNEHLAELLTEALAEWKVRESIMFKGLGLSATNFDQWFSSRREEFFRENGNIEDGTVFSRAVLGAREIVPNMGWVRTFACLLPRAVLAQQRILAEVGRRMAAIFYLAKMDKWRARSEAGIHDELAEYFAGIDAYWKCANELVNERTKSD